MDTNQRLRSAHKTTFVLFGLLTVALLVIGFFIIKDYFPACVVALVQTSKQLGIVW